MLRALWSVVNGRAQMTLSRLLTNLPGSGIIKLKWFSSFFRPKDHFAFLFLLIWQPVGPAPFLAGHDSSAHSPRTANPGTSPRSALQSLSKVNRE